MANLCENQNTGDDSTDFQDIEAKRLTSSLKTTVLGRKVIRVEIYNANQFSSMDESACRCHAEICAQHVVSNIHLDQIYPRIREILKCMDNKMFINL